MSVGHGCFMANSKKCGREILFQIQPSNAYTAQTLMKLTHTDGTCVRRTIESIVVITLHNRTLSRTSEFPINVIWRCNIINRRTVNKTLKISYCVWNFQHFDPFVLI